MRLYSDLQSSNRGEISALAIIETLLSVAAYVGIAYWFDTVQHIVFAALLAPLWLLRTKGSVRLGLRWYERLNSWRYGPQKLLDSVMQRVSPFQISAWRIAHQPGLVSFLVRMLQLLLFPSLLLSFILVEITSAWLIRFAATATAFVRHPLVHFVAVRKNWKRLILATDMGTIPEWLPGAAASAKIFPRSFLKPIPLPEVLHDLKRVDPALFLVIGLPLLYLVPIILRTAVKGASILYTPLFLVINSDPINHRLDLGTRLTEMQHDNTAILKRGYAFFVIGSFLLTLFFSSVVAKSHAWFQPEATPVFILLAEYYFPSTLRVWQLVSAVNGIIFLYLSWFYAPQAARRLEKGVWKPSDVRTYLNRWIGVQMVLSIYSTMCAVAIFANFFLHHQFPARHWQWFPVVGW